MANWYYAVGGQAEGPVDEEQLRSLARQGRLTPSSYVIPAGEQTWSALSSVEVAIGLTRNSWGTYADPPAGVAPPTPVPAPAPSGYAEPPSAYTPAPVTAPAPDVTTPAAGWGSAPGGWGAPPADTGSGQPPGWGQPPAWGQPPTWGEQSWAQPAPTTWAVAGTTGPTGEPLASWGARFGAKLIDFVVLLVPAVILFLLVAGNEIRDRLDSSGTGVQFTSGPRSSTASIAVSVVGLIYYAVLNGSGQTLGKRLLGLKVVDRATGAPIGIGRGLARHVLQFLCSLGVVFCIGWVFILVDALWPLWDKEKQALHDKLGRSVVIKSR